MNYRVTNIKDKNTGTQNVFLRNLCENKTPVSIYLLNGIRLTGVIESFDQHIVMLKGRDKQMIYKHAISSVLASGSDDV